jgi:hypothetical protein
MQLPDSMTKQGVRDLNSLGPQKKRVSTETSKRKHDDDGQPAAAPKSVSTSAAAADAAVPTPVPTSTPTVDATVPTPGTPNSDG